MGLQRIQEQLARLLMETAQRQAFAEDPQAFLQSQGHRAADLRLLASLDPDDLGYFASRRQIDRVVALRAELPRSLRLLESKGRVLPYFRAHPYAKEGGANEARQFAAWARKAARAGNVPSLLADLATFEAEVLHLSLKPYRAPKPSAIPKRAGGTAMLRLAHPAHLVRGKGAARVTPEPTFLGLVRTADDVLWYRYEAVDDAILRVANGRRSEAEVAQEAARRAGVPTREAASSMRQLRQVGLLKPRATKRQP